jgi:hypothetical protein
VGIEWIFSWMLNLCSLISYYLLPFFPIKFDYKSFDSFIWWKVWVPYVWCLDLVNMESNLAFVTMSQSIILSFISFRLHIHIWPLLSFFFFMKA